MDTPEPLEGNLEEDIPAQVAEWERKLDLLAAETSDQQIALPKKIQGRRVNREEIANAFMTSFELVGGTPRLALWADGNYGEFVKIFGRLLPKETMTVHEGKIELVHSVPPSKLDE